MGDFPTGQDGVHLAILRYGMEDCQLSQLGAQSQRLSASIIGPEQIPFFRVYLEAFDGNHRAKSHLLRTHHASENSWGQASVALAVHIDPTTGVAIETAPSDLFHPVESLRAGQLAMPLDPRSLRTPTKAQQRDTPPRAPRKDPEVGAARLRSPSIRHLDNFLDVLSNPESSRRQTLWSVDSLGPFYYPARMFDSCKPETDADPEPFPSLDILRLSNAASSVYIAPRRPRAGSTPSKIPVPSTRIGSMIPEAHFGQRIPLDDTDDTDDGDDEELRRYLELQTKDEERITCFMSSYMTVLFGYHPITARQHCRTLPDRTKFVFGSGKHVSSMRSVAAHVDAVVYNRSGAHLMRRPAGTLSQNEQASALLLTGEHKSASAGSRNWPHLKHLCQIATQAVARVYALHVAGTHGRPKEFLGLYVSISISSKT
ncbi:hypothetical protein ANO11243_067680 [Dothideomycetidae sp. 11243]|nr:hypothetical protein ANO11243_067680 [fungal sp. No.11243]